MKRKTIPLILFFFMILGMASLHLAYAQKPAKTLTFLYSNNINGEIEPCPT